jgi:hypothetical protein
MEMLLESVAWIALGFVPTLSCLEMSWRMGKVVGKRRRMTVYNGIMDRYDIPKSEIQNTGSRDVLIGLPL